jgi:PLD-like domain
LEEGAPVSTDRRLQNVSSVIERHVQDLKKEGVVSIRPGYKLENDWPSKEPAIVVIKSQGTVVSIPHQIEGIKVDVRDATPVEQNRYEQPEKFAALAARRGELRGEAFPEIDPAVEATAVPATVALEDIDLQAAKKPQLPYSGPSPAVHLESVTGTISFICHASPDAGWPTLKAFLSQTNKSLTVGLYDFTSAHILEHVKSVFTGQEFMLTLDNPALNPTADQSDPDTIKALSKALGDSFNAAWALVRQNKDITQWIYPTAYHIKVAVRDSESVWLSSGNWNNSNQPDIDPVSNPQPGDQQTATKSDRDWHVIIDDVRVATIYEAYLKHDYEVASGIAPATGPGVLAVEMPEQMPAEFEVEAKAAWQFFKPLRITEEATITPLLTPDPGDYQRAMLDLINSARKKLYVQLQYIHPSDASKDQGLTDLIDAVIAKIKGALDVRIIVSQWQLSQGWLEKLQAAGIDLSIVKVQNGVHNKGFVIDSSKVAIGSENWSGDGVLRNRDASVVIESKAAAAYFEQIFLHDWSNIARQSVRQ